MWALCVQAIRYVDGHKLFAWTWHDSPLYFKMAQILYVMLVGIIIHLDF